MKKQGIISIVLAAVLSVSFLTACGKSNTAGNTQPKSLPAVSAVETKASSESSTSSEPESSASSKPESSVSSEPESSASSEPESSVSSEPESSTSSKPESSVSSEPESSTSSKPESSASSEPESSTSSEPESSVSSKPVSIEESSEEESKEVHSEPVSEVTSSEPSVQEQPSKAPVSRPAEGSKQTSEKETVSKPADEPVKVSRIRLSKSSFTMYEGGTYKLDCYIEPSNAADKSFTWMWTDTSVITIESDGHIKALKPGNVTITAKTPAGLSAVCNVTVKERPPKPGKPTGVSVDASWFDDAVFVGDSVTNALYNYSEDNDWLGDADFICSVGIGYYSALWDIDRQGNLHPVFNGRKVTIDDAVGLVGKNKVFIMLGMNDLGGYTPQSTVNNMLELCDRILEKNPHVQIYIESITPLIASMDNQSGLNNRNIKEYNRLAAQACDERGFIFVNVAEAVSDENGNLKDELCFDPNYMGLHLNYAGCTVWVNYLKDHVA